MDLDPELCYRALASKDARFDGRFFVAVKTTGIYCRPICPARTPRRVNVDFYPCAAAAAEAGFRPCLRCRPEVSPGTPAWMGTSATVSRALRLIHEGALDEGGVAQLAGRLGVGARHLRRLFTRHLGATPTAVAQTRRLHFARVLLRETALPITQVAFAAGYASLRRFNAAFKQACGAPPSALRKGRVASAEQQLTLQLAYRPPYDWPFVADFLAARAIPGVERADRRAYRRTVRIGGAEGALSVRPGTSANRLEVTLRLSQPGPLLQLVERVRRLFDLGAEPAAIAETLGEQPFHRPGIRVPGAWCGFETAVRAVLGQQVSVPAANTLAGRLVQALGEPVGDPVAGLTHHFPGPERLAGADLSGLGLPARRGETIRALAAAAQRGELPLDGARGLEASVAPLLALPGVGPWTAHYIAMRVLGEPDAFPAADLGLRRAAAAGGRTLTPARLERLAVAWRPWRAYAAVSLWSTLRGEADAGDPSHDL